MRTQRVRSENRRYSLARLRLRSGTHPNAGRPMSHNIFGTFRRHGLRDGKRSGATAVFRHTFLVYLVVRGPIATTLTISAFISDLAGFVLDIVEPSKISLILGYTGTIIAFVMACYALGYAALSPGVVTVHRVLGAIALYLNIGLMFGTIYALIWYFIPNSFTNIRAVPVGGLMERSSILALSHSHRLTLAMSHRCIPSPAHSLMWKPSSANCTRQLYSPA
jgi:hypothetical protein